MILILFPEYHSTFGKNWPIDTRLYNRIAAHSVKLVASMNPELNFREMVLEEEDKADLTSSAEDLLEALKKDEDSSPLSRLTDILYNRKCISFKQKQQLDACRSIHCKNKFIVQAWLKGNVDALHTAFTYLRGTGQSWVIGILMRFPLQGRQHYSSFHETFISRFLNWIRSCLRKILQYCSNNVVRCHQVIMKKGFRIFMKIFNPHETRGGVKIPHSYFSQTLNCSAFWMKLHFATIQYYCLYGN